MALLQVILISQMYDQENMRELIKAIQMSISHQLSIMTKHQLVRLYHFHTLLPILDYSFLAMLLHAYPSLVQEKLLNQN